MVKCRAFGLSFFDSAEHAKSKYIDLIDRINTDPLEIGTHLAEGVLEKGFGQTGLTNKEGHFTHHPYEKTHLKEHFTILDKF